MSTRGEYAKGRARREQILTEAVALFAGSGYQAASLRDLAARCGLSQAGLLHHVGGKEALLLAVLRQRDVEDAAALELQAGTGRERLAALLDVVRRNVGRRGTVELFSVLSAEATSPAHPAHAFFDERYRQVVAALTDAFADCGHPRPGSAARRLVAVLDGLQVQWLLHPDDVDMVAEVDAQIAVELASAGGSSRVWTQPAG
ncbi:TetR/AcrR family transcriptional regulator [Kineococcus rhizosphaerae]|uniref:TetR family transcriptional regulator n=1 Tax=Kineococcus rhizosphaerae TaxID=559628 RepID=A0A2T0R7R9_9ACTN|nr:TetR/AcrR family transcriptional regulator [Kineococcus rhizosphaerae]PRY17216.1 TetR family transcriptional regulator [Kineococcus rhizosphaerae]